MIDWGGLFGLVGPLAICVMLVVMGLLSKRLGSVTRIPRYYLGFYLASGLMGLSILARLLDIGRGSEVANEVGKDTFHVLMFIGLPSIALTLALVVAWRYWSWLLAERG